MSTAAPSTGVAEVAPPASASPRPAPAPGNWGVVALLAVAGALVWLLRKAGRPAGAAEPEPSHSPAPSADSGHPGLTHDELLVLLTAAAVEVVGKPVNIIRFRALTPMDWTWAVQGRVDIHTSHHIR